MFGRIVGTIIGLSLSGNLVGGIAGFLIGFAFDEFYKAAEKPNREHEFWSTNFSYLFTILHAKFAKIDGIVSPSEVRSFEEMFIASAEDHETIRTLYNTHRKSAENFENAAVQLAILLDKNFESLKPWVLESLCLVGFKENPKLNEDQRSFILLVGRIFAFSDAEIYSIIEKIKSYPEFSESYFTGQQHSYNHSHTNDTEFQSLSAHFAMLGIPSTDDEETIKKAYKKAIRTHHPDRLRGNGASEKEIKKAEEKLAKINHAYSAIIKKE